MFFSLQLKNRITVTAAEQRMKSVSFRRQSLRHFIAYLHPVNHRSRDSANDHSWNIAKPGMMNLNNFVKFSLLRRTVAQFQWLCWHFHWAREENRKKCFCPEPFQILNSHYRLVPDVSFCFYKREENSNFHWSNSSSCDSAWSNGVERWVKNARLWVVV